MTEPRGIRNNNPGNIKVGQKTWLGQISLDTRGFCVFSLPDYGIRAMAVILGNYHKLHGLSTIAEFISRWAPRDENNTAAYVLSVCRRLGVSASDPYDVSDAGNMERLVEAIIWHENGQQPYSKELIHTAVALGMTAQKSPSAT